MILSRVQQIEALIFEWYGKLRYTEFRRCKVISR